jgi:excisionase family DNA binding protein
MMDTKKRALQIQEFCDMYGVGKSTMYEEVKAGRLQVRKIGKRSLIAVDDADRWLANLPKQQAAAAE